MKSFFRSLVVSILTAEARLLLRRHKPTIVAITGSVGKTSTKDAIYVAIKDSVRARKSQKSFNSEIGVPLTILGLPTGWDNPLRWVWNVVDGAFTVLFTRTYPNVLVLETGVDTPGDMEQLVSWLKPDVVVLTRLPDVPVHVEQFSSPAAVIEEKMKLVHGMHAEGTLIYNHDDEIIKNQLPEVRQKSLGYGRYLPTEFKVEKDTLQYKDDVPSGLSFSVVHGDEKSDITLAGVVGTQHALGCAAALAVAQVLGIKTTDAAKGLQTLSAPPGRLRIIAGIKGSVLIDDTYNSSPIALEHALETLSEIKYAKRRIAVLGDMLELGKYSSDEHRRLGKRVGETCDVLLTLGVRARGFAEGALSNGLNDKTVFQYENVARAGRELQAMLQPGDVVLVKASQSIRAERVIQEVMAEPERAEQLLARQDRDWRATI
jgi:UDP-N-acetylmuramyl pentapeptide synthase